MAAFDFGPDDVRWLLLTINNLNDSFARHGTYSHLPIHKNIWRGSYDVWSCEQDKIGAVEIPKSRMKQAEEDGLIASEKKMFGKYTVDVWHLTELGKKTLGHGEGIVIYDKD